MCQVATSLIRCQRCAIPFVAKWWRGVARGLISMLLPQAVNKHAGNIRQCTNVHKTMPPSSVAKTKKRSGSGRSSSARSEAKGYEALSGSALLSLAVGVGQQLSVKLSAMHYASRHTFDQAGHIAALHDVRNVTARQADAVSEAKTQLSHVERVLFCRLAMAEIALSAHTQHPVACENCCAQR